MAQTRTQGANARAQSWDDFDIPAAPPKNASWLPLSALDDEAVYAGTPQLRAMAGAGRAQSASPPTRQHPQASPTASQRMVIAPTGRGGGGQVAATALQGVLTQAPGKQRRQSREQSADAPKAQAKAIAIAAGGMLAVLALYVIVSAAIAWTQTKLDDFQYGRPRTSQMDAYVGHSESEGNPSHFIAMNLNRRVTILELPGGDSTKAATIVGPYLFGQGEDLTPVQIDAKDLNGDGKPDLVVSVKSEQLLYLNDGAAFKLATPDEQAAIQKSLSSRGAAPLNVQATPAEVAK